MFVRKGTNEMGYDLLTTYVVFINLFAFIAMGADKRRAKKGKWRISEQFLLFVAFIGGALGMIVGANFFRHKTKKFLFTIGLPAIVIFHVILVYFIIFS